jgi:hypothetical protein
MDDDKDSEDLFVKLNNESNKKSIEINVYLDKLDKLNIEYSKATTTVEIIEITDKMEDIMKKINYSLNFLELMLEKPEEVFEMLEIKNDIRDMNELQQRLDENEKRLDKYSLEKQCEEYVKLKLALNASKKTMKDRTMLVRKIK